MAELTISRIRRILFFTVNLQKKTNLKSQTLLKKKQNYKFIINTSPTFLAIRSQRSRAGAGQLPNLIFGQPPFFKPLPIFLHFSGSVPTVFEYQRLANDENDRTFDDLLPQSEKLR